MGDFWQSPLRTQSLNIFLVLMKIFLSGNATVAFIVTLRTLKSSWHRIIRRTAQQITELVVYFLLSMRV
jgi:hypothetical protein